MLNKASIFLVKASTITLVMIAMFSCQSGNNANENAKEEDPTIKDTYTRVGNVIHFDYAEMHKVNGDMVPFTQFQYPEPDEYMDRVKHNAWIESYVHYHYNNVGVGRINYFFKTEGPWKPNEIYKFFIGGYYADFSYEVRSDNKGDAEIYYTPLKWYKR
jgi:hypothetical protein